MWKLPSFLIGSLMGAVVGKIYNDWELQQLSYLKREHDELFLFIDQRNMWSVFHDTYYGRARNPIFKPINRP